MSATTEFLVFLEQGSVPADIRYLALRMFSSMRGEDEKAQFAELMQQYLAKGLHEEEEMKEKIVGIMQAFESKIEELRHEEMKQLEKLEDDIEQKEQIGKLKSEII